MSSPPLKRHIMQAAAVLLILLTSTTQATTPATAQATGGTPDAVTRTGWGWPAPKPHPIVRPYIAPETPYSSGHRGIDIAVPLGTVVQAPADGVIHFSGFVVHRNLVSIDHGGGLLSSFEPVLSALTEGTVVHRGEQIGVLQSGHCQAPCLHFGVRLHGQYISPLNYLVGIPHSVLLPTRKIR